MITYRNFTQENETASVASYLQQLAQQTVRYYYASIETCDIDDVDF